jgi:integrative and conjugative element protein (TIGR02256 family)
MPEKATITLNADAGRTIRSAAQAAQPHETGGILIGWRCGSVALGINVVASLVVEDPNAGRATFRLDRDRAQAALDRYLEEQQNLKLGYVGEWHSHPEPQPPSPQDLRSLRASARLALAPVGLVVLALNPHDSILTWHARVAQRRPRLRTIRAHTATVKEEQHS